MSRRPWLDPEAVLAAHAAGQSAAEIATSLGAKPPAITRRLARLGVALHPRRTNTVPRELDAPLSEQSLRQLARQIDRTWRAPEPIRFDNRPCGNCAVRGPQHRAHGCRIWR